MRKLLALLLMLLLAFSLFACGEDVPSEPEDNNANGGTVENPDPEPTPQPEPTPEPEPAPEPEDTEPDYTAYSNILHAYEVAHSTFESEPIYLDDADNPLYFGTYGLSYIDLIDFDNNGVLELVFAVNERNYSSEYVFLDYYESLLHIYTITPDQGLISVFETTQQYFPINYDAFGIEYWSDGDLTYLGMGDEWGEDGITYYQLVDNSFVEAKNFTNLYDYETDIATTSIDGQSVPNEQYSSEKDAFMENIERVLTFGMGQKELDIIVSENEKAREFLSDYPRANYQMANAYFNDGMFAVIEGEAQTPQEQLIVNYYMAYAKKDFDALAQTLAPELKDSFLGADKIAEDFETGYFMPGHIISEISTIEPEDYGVETVHVAELVYPTVEQLGLTDHYLIRYISNEALDQEITFAWGQVTGGRYRQWALVGSRDDGKTWHIYDIFDDKFFWHDEMFDNALAAAFVGYAGDFEFYDKSPGTDLAYMLEYYLGDEFDYKTLELTEYVGDELYVIRAAFGASIMAYENTVDQQGNNVRGALITQTEEFEPLLIMCNESDLYSNVEIVIITPAGIEYNYYPAVGEYNMSIENDYVGQLHFAYN